MTKNEFMRYKIIDVYQKQQIERYIAKCLKQQSPQYIVIESPIKLCRELDIVDVDAIANKATWATGEKIDLQIISSGDSLDKIYEIDR